MKLLVKKGRTSFLVKVFIQDSTSTTGAGKTGLAFNTSSLVCYRARDDDGNAGGTAITLATATKGTWASGGFVEKDATNMPGIYEFGIPDNALATGSETCVIALKGATGMAPLVLEIQLVAFDPQDTVRLGLTAMPNAAAGANGGLPLSVDTSGRVDVLKVNGTSQTARDLGASVLLSPGTGTGQISLTSGAVTVGTNNDKTGYTLTQTFPTNFSSLSIDGSGRVDVTKIGGTSQTAGDVFGRIGAPAGASIAADIAAVKVDTGTSGSIYTRLGAPAGASVSADVAAVKAVLPAALTGGGNIKSDALAINGSTTGAANLAKTTPAIARGTVTTSATTTSIPTSAFTPAGAVADQFKGRVVLFDVDTTTAALRGQAATITASSNAATPTLTVSALTTAPASGDTFSVV